MVKLPSSKPKKPLWLRERFTLLPVLLAGLFVAIGNIVRAILNASVPLGTSPDFWISVTLFVLMILLAAIRFWQASHQESITLNTESPQDILGCLRVIHGLIKTYNNANEISGEARCTFHRVVDDEWLEQVIPYVNDVAGEKVDEKVGRRFSIRSGVVGEAVRTRRPSAFQRQDQNYDDYVEVLIREWNMIKKEAEETRRDRFAFLAVPVVDRREHVVAAIYFDADEPSYFSDDIVNLILGSLPGLVDFLEDRYP